MEEEKALITVLQKVDLHYAPSLRELARSSTRVEQARRAYRREAGPESTWCLNGRKQRDAFRPIATRGALLYAHTKLLEAVAAAGMGAMGFRTFVERFRASLPPKQTWGAQGGTERLQTLLCSCTHGMLATMCAALDAQHSTTFALGLALSARLRRGFVSRTLVETLLAGGANVHVSADGDEIPNTTGWLPEEAWSNMLAMIAATEAFKEEYRAAGVSISTAIQSGMASETLLSLPKLLNAESTGKSWKLWYESGGSHQRPLPLADNHTGA